MAANTESPLREQAGARTIIVTVNRNDVTFDVHRVTGLQIKETAIRRGVQIQPDFALFEVLGAGGLRPVPDDEAVELREREAFRAVAPDDNSDDNSEEEPNDAGSYDRR